MNKLELTNLLLSLFKTRMIQVLQRVTDRDVTNAELNRR